MEGGIACKPNGICLWFTGLCNSGKSSIAQELFAHEKIKRRAALLDGDNLRGLLWAELGSSWADRHQKALRLAYPASLVVRFGGIALVVIISPYSEDRLAARQMIEPFGRFFEIFVDTPLEVCEKRDRRDFYRLARQGVTPRFTGISDVYDTPQAPEFHLYTTVATAQQNSTRIIRYLERERLL